MASTVDSDARTSPSAGDGQGKSRSTLTMPAPLSALAGVVVCAAWSLGEVTYSIPVAGVLLLCAYGLFMRWVRLHAETGNGFVRFLEQVRRAIAFESPDQPSR